MPAPITLDYQHIATVYRETRNVSQTARDCGVSITSVYRVLAAAGIEPPGVTTKPDRNKQMREQRDEGWSLGEIAQFHKVSRQRVHVILKEDWGDNA